MIDFNTQLHIAKRYTFYLSPPPPMEIEAILLEAKAEIEQFLSENNDGTIIIR